MDWQRSLKPKATGTPEFGDTFTLNGVIAPLTSDWARRGELWQSSIDERVLTHVKDKQRFGAEAAIYHDGASDAVEIAQLEGSVSEDPSFFVQLSVSDFKGTFVSIAIDLPREALHGLTRGHLVRSDVTIDANCAQEAYGRLNVLNGKNTERFTSAIRLNGRSETDFDLFHSELDENQIEAAWFDVIFANPHAGTARIEDLVLSRRPRARF